MILSSESFDEPFNGKNLIYICLVNGTFFPDQLAGLGYGCKRIRDIFNTDLIYLTVSPSGHPGGK